MRLSKLAFILPVALLLAGCLSSGHVNCAYVAGQWNCDVQSSGGVTPVPLPPAPAPVPASATP